MGTTGRKCHARFPYLWAWLLCIAACARRPPVSRSVLEGRSVIAVTQVSANSITHKIRDGGSTTNWIMVQPYAGRSDRVRASLVAAAPSRQRLQRSLRQCMRVLLTLPGRQDDNDTRACKTIATRANSGGPGGEPPGALLSLLISGTACALAPSIASSTMLA